MSDQVKVDSVDAIRIFRTNLCKLSDTIRLGIEEANADIQKTLIWLRQEQTSYWKAQVRKRAELVNRAKIDLMRKQTEYAQLGARNSCVDEKKALAAAKRNLEHAEEKLQNVRRWTRQLDQESYNYRGAMQALAQSVESDVPRFLTHLDNMVTSLESYAAVEYPKETKAVSQALPDPDDEP